MTIAVLPISPGEVFCHHDRRYIFHGMVGERLHATDETGIILTVDDEELDGEAMPTELWFLQEYCCGRLNIPPASSTEQIRFERLLRMDVMAATLRDPKSLYRYTWAKQAQASGFKQNESAIREWILQAPLLAVPELAWSDPACADARALHQQLERIFARKPGARSVMGWMKKLDANAGSIGALVNQAGRPLGHSQLRPMVDRLVQRAAELYWSMPKEFPSMEDAAGLVERWWTILREEGTKDIGTDPPHYETTRRRIRGTENFENYERRFGRFAALAKFAPKGEPIPLSRPFEMIYLDGVEFEHYTLYSDEWGEVAGKLKGVIAMDAFSQFRWRWSIFYGPFRPEVAIKALMHAIVPPMVTAADIASDPTNLVFGIPSTIVYDNDRALLPPSLVPSLTQLGEITLNGVYHPNGKSPLEGSFRHDKGRLAMIKGRVLPPSHKKDPRYKPEAEANLTKAQYAIEAERARLEWNRTPKASLGWRSPNDIMLAHVKQGVQRYHG